jgi:mersacidin/lichenicidin family type 2 lantibiotic
MSDLDIIRAWKDPEYRSTLASIPAHPAGEIDLAGAGLDGRAAHDTHGESYYTAECGITYDGFGCCFRTHAG